MIPQTPFLQRNTYQSALSNSFYDPHTLITYSGIPDYTDFKNSEFVSMAFEYHATDVHERIHWLQHHGTSVGCFLTSLRFSQQMTTIRMLRELPAEKMNRLLHNRNLAAPILKIDDKRHRPLFENDQDLDLFRQIWFDHQWLQTIFEDSTIGDTAGLPPGLVIGEIFGDVMLALCADLNFITPESSTILVSPMEARKWFSMTDDELAYLKIGETHITTRSLMEAVATIAELQLLPNTPWQTMMSRKHLNDIFARRILRVIDGQYGIPIRGLLMILGYGLERMFELFPTVNVLCFVALNPPVPPYVMKPPKDSSSWAWADIYPPLRFMRLANCVKHVGLLNSCLDKTEISTYISKICDACNLPHTLDLDHPISMPKSDKSDSFNTSTTYNAADTELHGCYDYIFWVQSQLTQYRKNDLPLLVSVPDCLCGDLVSEYGTKLLYDSSIQTPIFHGPLIWTENDKIGFSCNSDFGHWLLNAMATYYSLFDAVVGIGPLDLSAFPPDLASDSQFHDTLMKSIEINLTQVRNS